MTARLERLTRPGEDVDYRSPSRHRTVGFALAFVGLLLAVVTLIANIAAASLLDGSAADASDAAETLAWSFGLTTTAFGTIKFAIAVILVGILIRLWLRVDSVKTALADLKAPGSGEVRGGSVETPFGTATAGASTPKPLPIHRMARTMWGPMIAMGAMAVLAGLIVSFAWAAIVADPSDAVPLSAWTQGLQFLGEGMLLAGISFLLGTILASLREGGGEVQEALGVTVVTLKMPTSAKVFVGLMMLGVMTAILQFILYLVVAGGVDTPAAWFAWLGPLREFSLGLLLAGVVLALITIGNVLGFQFDRIKQIITSGD